MTASERALGSDFPPKCWIPADVFIAESWSMTSRETAAQIWLEISRSPIGRINDRDVRDPAFLGVNIKYQVLDDVGV